MKKFKLLALIFLPFIIGCENIKRNDRFIEVPSIISERAVLLTEFTGVRCVNCPKAEEMAHQLTEAYGDTVIVVAMHPASNPFTNAGPQYNYTCPFADDYYTYFGGTPSTSFPIGVINFKEIQDKYFVDFNLWSGNIMSLLKQSSTNDFSLSSIRVEESRRFQIDVTDIRGRENAHFIIWLVEDSVIGPQYMPDGTIKFDYVHNHILRDVISSTWGDKSQTWTYSVPDTYNINHCSIVALMCDSTREVLNVKRKPIHISQIPEETKDSIHLYINGIENEITHDTTIVVNNIEINPLTNIPQMTIEGFLYYKGDILKVLIEREQSNQDDELCCGDNCVSTNGNLTQQTDYAIRENNSSWFAHFYPNEERITTLRYTFNFEGLNPIILTVQYDSRKE